MSFADFKKTKAKIKASRKDSSETHLSQPMTRSYFCEQCITYMSFIYEDNITDLGY